MAIEDNTDGVLKEVDRQIEFRLKKSALLVERTAKEKVKVLTGTMKRSIVSNWWGSNRAVKFAWSDEIRTVKGKNIRVKAGSSQIDAIATKSAIIGTNVEYAPYLEFRFPFLRAALHSNMAKIKKIFGG